MLRTSARPIATVLIAATLLTPSSFAFDTPLSDQAVREAYFLGQRHDEPTSPLSLSSLPLPFSSSNPASTLPVTVLSKRRSIIATRANS